MGWRTSTPAVTAADCTRARRRLTGMAASLAAALVMLTMWSSPARSQTATTTPPTRSLFPTATTVGGFGSPSGGGFGATTSAPSLPAPTAPLPTAGFSATTLPFLAPTTTRPFSFTTPTTAFAATTAGVPARTGANDVQWFAVGLAVMVLGSHALLFGRPRGLHAVGRSTSPGRGQLYVRSWRSLGWSPPKR